MALPPTCDNCGVRLDESDATVLWQGKAVCGPCYDELRRVPAPPTVRRPKAPPPAPSVAPRMPPPVPAHALTPLPPQTAAPEADPKAFLWKVVVALLVISPLPAAVLWYLYHRSAPRRSESPIAAVTPAPAPAGGTRAVQTKGESRGAPAANGLVAPPASADPLKPVTAPPPATVPPVNTLAPPPAPADDPPARAVQPEPARRRPTGRARRPATADAVAAARKPSDIAQPEQPGPSANPPTPRPVTPAPQPRSSPPSSSTDSPEQRGRKALAAERYADAADAFKEALKADPKSSAALHGLGLASYHLGRRTEAIAYLDKAFALTGGAERRVVYNLGVANLKDNPMRAAKIAREYLAKTSNPSDEQMLNLLGAALNRAEDKTTAYYADTRKFYFDYQQRMESKRADGRRRWGTEWVPGSDAASKWKEYEARATAVAAQRKEAGRAELRLKREEDRAKDVLYGMALRSEREMREARARLRAAADDANRVRQQLNKAESQLGATEKPPFPTDARPLPLSNAE